MNTRSVSTGSNHNGLDQEGFLNSTAFYRPRLGLDLFLLRHVEAEKNLRGQSGGGPESLTALGERQALRAGMRMLDWPNIEAFSAPDLRAQLSLAATGLTDKTLSTTVEGLAGIRMGAAAGLTPEELERSFPELKAQTVTHTGLKPRFKVDLNPKLFQKPVRRHGAKVGLQAPKSRYQIKGHHARPRTGEVNETHATVE